MTRFEDVLGSIYTDRDYVIRLMEAMLENDDTKCTEIIKTCVDNKSYADIYKVGFLDGWCANCIAHIKSLKLIPYQGRTKDALIKLFQDEFDSLRYFERDDFTEPNEGKV